VEYEGLAFKSPTSMLDHSLSPASHDDADPLRSRPSSFAPRTNPFITPNNTPGTTPRTKLFPGREHKKLPLRAHLKSVPTPNNTPEVFPGARKKNLPPRAHFKSVPFLAVPRLSVTKRDRGSSLGSVLEVELLQTKAHLKLAVRCQSHFGEILRYGRTRTNALRLLRCRELTLRAP
jgi:hypothetical protein